MVKKALITLSCVIIFIIFFTTPNLSKTGDGIYEIELNPGYNRISTPNEYTFFVWEWEGNGPEFRNNVNEEYSQIVAESVSHNQDDSHEHDEELNNERQNSIFYYQDLEKEIEVINSSTEKAKVYFIDGRENHSEGLQAQGQLNLNSGASYTDLPIVSRQDWGADESISDWDPSYYKADKFIIHHTAWTNNPNDYAETVRAIYRFHTLSRGWGDIGYNYLIAPDGTIFEGRKGGDSVIGAHTYLNNTASIGISFMGNYQSENITAAAEQALYQLVTEKALLHGITNISSSTLKGHRDYSSTACPGNHLYSQLPRIRTEINTLIATEITNNNPIYLANQDSIVNFNNYYETSLDLVFAEPFVSTQEALDLLPNNSNILRYEDIGNNTIRITADNFYGIDSYTEPISKYIQLLATIFNLDPNISEVKQAVKSPEIIYSQQTSLRSDYRLTDLDLKFSEPIALGTGYVNLKNITDNTSLLIPSTPENIRLYDREAKIDLQEYLDIGDTYQLDICDECFVDGSNNPLVSTSLTPNILFNTEIKFYDWQSGYGRSTHKPTTISTDTYTLQSVKGYSNTTLWWRITFDGVFDGSSSKENWHSSLMPGRSTHQATFAKYKNKIVITVKAGSNDLIYTTELDANAKWLGKWYLQPGRTLTPMQLISFNHNGDDYLVQFVSGKSTPTLYVKVSMDGVFDTENWIVVDGIETAEGISAIEFGNEILISGIKQNGELWVASSSKDDLNTWTEVDSDIQVPNHADMLVYRNQIIQVSRMVDNSIAYRSSNNGRIWGEWINIPGKTVTSPEFVLNKNGELQLYIVGTISGNIWQTQEIKL